MLSQSSVGKNSSDAGQSRQLPKSPLNHSRHLSGEATPLFFPAAILPSEPWGSDGRLTHTLPLGKHNLRGNPPLEINYIRTEQEFTVDKTPAEQPISLQLQRGCELILKAIDADSGAPISGATFRARGNRPHLDWKDISPPQNDKHGEVRATAIPGEGCYSHGPE